jgi:hypothetical protein
MVPAMYLGASCERGNAERRALAGGLWPPVSWLMGDSLRDSEQMREQLFGQAEEPGGPAGWPGSRSTTTRRGSPSAGVPVTGALDEERDTGDGAERIWGWVVSDAGRPP